DGRTVNGVPPGFANFTTNGYYVQGSYFLIPKQLQAAVRWEDLNPGQKGNDGIHSITGGLNYYIRGDDIKLMANYIHTWSDFRQANPQFGDDQFDEVIMRLQLMFKHYRSLILVFRLLSRDAPDITARYRFDNSRQRSPSERKINENKKHPGSSLHDPGTTPGGR